MIGKLFKRKKKPSEPSQHEKNIEEGNLLIAQMRATKYVNQKIIDKSKES